ncbi:hypothetical protein [Maricaulis parjimensis]|uniref:hypothetical protein n=1 Tax=Maricaulis parjimensis TaxID=144023 RepID=UPI001939B67C|nr:hypothetical protein [Maricaulis parjimensis]
MAGWKSMAFAALAGLAVSACSTPGYRTLNPSCVDPFPDAKYNRDGHQDTTYLVAVMAGRSPREAALLSFYNEAADDLALRFAAPQVSVWASFGGWTYRHRIVGVLHSLHGGGPEAVDRRRADLQRSLANRPAGENADIWQSGLIIHALGDSYAHTTGVGGDQGAYGELYGHLFDGHSPDYVAMRPPVYRAYIEALYAALEVPGSADRAAFEAFSRRIADLPSGAGEISRFVETIRAARDDVAPAPRMDCEALAGRLTMREVSRFLRELEAGFSG